MVMQITACHELRMNGVIDTGGEGSMKDRKERDVHVHLVDHRFRVVHRAGNRRPPRRRVGITSSWPAAATQHLSITQGQIPGETKKMASSS
jgi:hypothetical protein